jgi:hypothetical protein
MSVPKDDVEIGNVGSVSGSGSGEDLKDMGNQEVAMRVSEVRRDKRIDKKKSGGEGVGSQRRCMLRAEDCGGRLPE